ncbi:hypothetical protein AV654_03530 [Paenibacillus elgii]|uniref:histidine kinase n=1 Tax=Paenibacillus elgii TaxID=189691 RepID=A0A165Q4N3_9BACL|nr:HAMP domain-containing sensor histidine kinase [Paenibacillus elgii]KZE73662.1 hypothetical protein AV654_03530 [Paenibacillus elgii]
MKRKVIIQFLLSMSTLAILIVIVNYTALYFLAGGPAFENGRTAAFAERFTHDFGQRIALQGGRPYVTQEGLKELDHQRAWIQILDESGAEAFAYHKPPHALTHYSPSEIAFFYKYAVQDFTVFISRVEDNGYHWSYMIGFPAETVAKYFLYISPKNVQTFFPNGLYILVGVTLGGTLIIGYLFARRLSRPVRTVIDAIRELADGRYELRLTPKGIYKDVYRSLLHLSSTLSSLRQHRDRVDRMREEWIAGLSHDLKTPLSSIKGYGEVLAETSYDLSPDERTGYAVTIVRNAVYMEALLDDLRLTSQLKHNLLPMDKRESDVVRLLQETVILLLNSPEGEDRTISFDANPQTILLSFDAKLLQRAFLNLLFNALVHNPAGTQVQVAVSGDESGVRVVIADNGVGISKEDMAKLFDRYYRGTNTAASHQGSGLGLAIARQIIEAHDGKVEVESRLGHGTTIIVHFPQT